MRRSTVTDYKLYAAYLPVNQAYMTFFGVGDPTKDARCGIGAENRFLWNSIVELLVELSACGLHMTKRKNIYEITVK